MKPGHPPLPRLLLEAALSLDGDFSQENLIVRAWELYPHSFGLAGYRTQYPDSNKIIASLSHFSGPVKRGWLDRVGCKLFRVTDMGRAVSASVPGEIQPEPSRPTRNRRASKIQKVMRRELARYDGGTKRDRDAAVLMVMRRCGVSSAEAFRRLEDAVGREMAKVEA